MTRLKHALAVLAALGAAVAPAWLDPQQTWTARAAITAATLLFMLVNPAKLKSMRAGIIGGLALAGVVVAAIAGRYSAGTGGAAVVGFVAAVLAQLRTFLPAAIDAGAVGAVPASEAPTKPTLVAVPKGPSS